EVPGGSCGSAYGRGPRDLPGDEHRRRAAMERGARRAPHRATRLPLRAVASEHVADPAVRHRRVSADRGPVFLDAAASASGWIWGTPDRNLSAAPPQRPRPDEAISGSDVGRGDPSRQASCRDVRVAAAWDLVERSRVCGPLRVPVGYGPTVRDRRGAPAIFLCGHCAPVHSVLLRTGTFGSEPAARRNRLARSPTRGLYGPAGRIPRGRRHASAPALSPARSGDPNRLAAA